MALRQAWKLGSEWTLLMVRSALQRWSGGGWCELRWILEKGGERLEAGRDGGFAY